MMPRTEFFAGLSILACVNGLGAKVIQAVKDDGWSTAIANSFGVSAIVWIACLVGLSGLLHQKASDISTSDFVVGLCVLVLIALPIGQTSWLALTLLMLHAQISARELPLRF